MDVLPYEPQLSSQVWCRPEALESQRGTALGNDQDNASLTFWAISLLAVACVATATTYLYLGHYIRGATVDSMRMRLGR